MTQQESAGRQVAAAPPSAAETAPKDDGRLIRTIAEQGPNLPLGFPGADAARTIVVRPWRTKEEREIGRLKKPKMGMGEHVTLVLTHMLSRVGPHVWDDEVKQPTRKVQLGTMYLADVMYLYVWLRIQAIGKTLKMDLTCPACGHSFRFAGDLETVEVRGTTRADALRRKYVLEDPIELRKKKVTSVAITGPLWHQVSGIPDGSDEGLGKIIAVQSSIVGLNDDPEPVALGDFEVDELSKRDLESLANLINEDFFGPRMVIESVCAKESCGKKMIAPIDWRYDRFFTTSSQ
jgi:hypothetical protein